MQTFRDAYQYRHILGALTAKELKAMYRSMSLGFLWSLLSPLVMVSVLSFVLVVFFHGEHYGPSLVIVGLIPYNFFSYCVTGSASSILGNSTLVKKVSFPRQILPFSVVLTNLVHFAIQSILIVVVLLVFHPPNAIFGTNLLWLAPVFAIQVGLCLGVGLLVAALNVVYRDTQYIIESGLGVLFWLSPVLYDAGAMFQKNTELSRVWYWLYYANPLSGVLESYRVILFHGQAPDVALLAVTLFSTLVIGAIGVRVFWVHERQFADLIT